MNKKGQSALYVFFALVIFGLIFFTGLSTMVATVGNQAVESGNVTGINAWFYGNINLIIFIFWMVALIVTLRVGL